MERGDLIVVLVGGYEGLGSKRIRHDADMGLRQMELVESVAIRLKILTDRRHNRRVTAQHIQGISDIASAAAKFASHIRYQERDVKNMNLIRQDVILEAIAEHHDGIVGKGTAD
jgi:hypothetical protein